MQCRNCGAQIADKALICYRCGTATTEAKYQPAPLPRSRSRSGLVATVLAYATGITALRHLPASVASVLGMAEPVLATVIAWAVLGETLAWIQALGAAVLLAGAYTVQRNTATITS